MNPSCTDQKTVQEQGLTESPDDACTAACTSETESGRSDRVSELAEALRKLSPDERARLAELLQVDD